MCNIKQKQKKEHNVFISIKGTSRKLWIFHVLISHILFICNTMFTLLKLRCFYFYLFFVFNISWLQLSIYPLVHSFPLPSTSPMIHSASISLPKKAGLPRIFTQQSITSCSSKAENLYQGWMRKRVSWEEELEPSTPTVRNITQQTNHSNRYDEDSWRLHDFFSVSVRLCKSHLFEG